MIRRLWDPRLLCCAILGFSLAACGSSSSSGGQGGAGQVGGHGGTSDGGVGGKTGAGGTAGRSASGGAGGFISPACATPAYTHVSTFGAIFDGWVVATNSTPPSLAPMPGLDGGPATGTKVELDATDGMPTTPFLGSAKLTVPFANPAEELLFAQNSSGLNMAGTTVTAQIKLDSGLNTSPTDVGRAFLTLKSTSAYIYVAGPAVSLDRTAGWVGLSINTDTPQVGIPPGYDPCDIREIDVVVQTGTAGTYTSAVIHIDTIAVTAPGVDAGAGTDGAGTDGSADGRPPADAPVDAPATIDASDASTAIDATAPQDAAVDSPG